MDHVSPYTRVALGLVVASAFGLAYAYKTKRTADVTKAVALPVKEEVGGSKTVAESSVHVSYRVTSDMTDANGRMFAGEILKLIDVVAGVASRRHAETGCVTITLDRFILVQEIKVGDLVHLKTGVKVIRENCKTGKQSYCCHAYLTFVALAPSPPDHKGPPASIRLAGRKVEPHRPKPKLKKVQPLTLIERRRYMLAGHRRGIRISQSAEANDLSSFRAEVLGMYSTIHLDNPQPITQQQAETVSSLEKELLADALLADDPALVRSYSPDGEEMVSITKGLHDGLDAPIFKVSDLKETIEQRQRARRNTWVPQGGQLGSLDMKRSVSSWMAEPTSPNVKFSREVDIQSPIDELKVNGILDQTPRVIPMTDTFASTLHIVMPQHANSNGVLFGGQLMEWMEKTALIAAHRLRRDDCCWTTAGMDGLEFREAVAIGDVLTFRAVVTRTWRSSIEVYVCSHADIPGAASSPRFTNECFLSLVSSSPTTSTVTPLNTEVCIDPDTAAQKVSQAADARKIERLNMKEMLIRMYAAPQVN
ncbi:Acyl-coenzyme A thioesterase 12 [Tulasnella sp. 403]|nr:Acyl-coenzyme A thioesterase 12 [Tulasnella sp. 403]